MTFFISRRKTFMIENIHKILAKGLAAIEAASD
jgi:hypothetical protein